METINTEKTKTQMRKGILEMCILSIISKNKEAYVSDIIEALKSADMIVVEGTLYPLLTRLKNENLLDYNWKESNSGPPRKYYVLTDNGTAFLKEIVKSWQELQTMVNKII
ncbi:MULTISPECIES: PadR family transcriptional regulator [Capnocytophaga]|uniref:PadR family transcriptional regulator n=1 Tax=Capnocytophaga TaxID=1016 RepID=UPI0037D7B17E